jgi:aldehyde:ferredoxin oxidoreductase
MDGGWTRKILSVDLTSGKQRTLTPDAEVYRKFIGGTGLAARFLFEMMPPEADPLGPENVVAIFTGPVTGTHFPGVGRVALAALSPLTGLWGQSIMGGYLGLAIKRAGWDGFLLSGAAAQPIYLLVQDDQVQLMAANDLWGLDTYQTYAVLKERYPHAETTCIGPAGENLVPMASVMQRPGKTGGRTGIGAVLGSKKVKAIVVLGTGRVKIADRQAFDALLDRHAQVLSKSLQTQAYASLGTANMVTGVMTVGDMPVRNWSGEIWMEGAEKLSGEAIIEQILVKREGCHACTIRCKAVVQVQQEDGTFQEGPGPEYETLGAMGSLLHNDDLCGVARANELCNRLGLDTISTGSTLAWAIEASQSGALPLSMTGDARLDWGEAGTVCQLIQDIAYRRNELGELLSGGSARASQQLGAGSQAYAINVKGLDMAMHHPRVFPGLGVAYTFLPHGASHMEGGFLQRKGGEPLEKWMEKVVESIRMGTLMNQGVFCFFTMPGLPMNFLSELFRSLTGETLTAADLRASADRDYLLRYLFNLRFGHRPDHDILPERIVKQMQQADPRWIEDWPRVKQVFYALKGFDAQGYPTQETIQRAGLEELVGEML